MKKTIITIFAAVCLLLTMFPATAFAAAPTVCRADICGGQDFAAERIAFVKPTVTATGSQVRICKYCEAESDDITPRPRFPIRQQVFTPKRLPASSVTGTGLRKYS
jgi:hypothetical protein